VRVDKVLPWVVRSAWASLPLAAGPTLADRLNDWDTATRTMASALLWVGWALVAVGTCVALPACLALTRVGVASGLVVAGAARSPGVAAALIAAAAAARPEVAEWFVNGPAYPNERRFPLRVPGALILGPLWLAAAVAVAGPAAGLLLLADGNWALGVPVTAIGTGVAVIGARALGGLTRRWVVFVPAGLVVHDPIALTDPVLFERSVIESLRAAPADTDSLDLTQGALGLALELVLREKVPIVLAKGRRGAESGASARLLITPTRPGRVLAEAAERRIAAG
jgi:hypothetical protein